MATACVSQRCGLCGFELQKDDKIVAITDDGRQSGEMYNDLLMNEEQGVTFKQCVGACSHPDGRAIGCHAMCANHIPSTWRAALLKVLAYQYEPAPFEIARRMRWIRLRFASSPLLRHAKPPLPQELRLQIATHLLQGPELHRHAVACTHSLPENMGSGSSRIRLSVQIWARFIDFEGVRYISSLGNSRDDHHTESIFTPDPNQLVDYIFMAENYLGVMQIHFCSSAQAPAIKGHQGLWWRVIRLCDRDQMLITQTDGVKLRTIGQENEETGPHAKHPLWSVPPLGPVRSVQLVSSPPPTQLSMLICNEPGVTAYSVYWNCGIMSLHAHTTGEDLALYNGHKEGIWVYFPLEEGEKISEIWNHYQFIRGSTLIFKTTHGRVALFGPRFKAQPVPRSTLIDLPYQDRGSRLFFERSPLGVRNLAFETPEPAPPSGSLALNQPLSQYPRSTFFETYFYSAASLDGVDKVVPCQRYIRGRRRIIGLLLQFPEGRQSCVGQIRLDSLDNPLQAHGHQKVWLGFSTDDHRPFVSALTLSEPKLTEGLSWLEVQLCGTLEWWFSLRQCQVYYMGKSSPLPRL